MLLFHRMFLLFLIEGLVYVVILGIDYNLKRRKCKMIKAPKLMIRSKYCFADKISRVAFWFQIFNYLYIFLYILIATIETYAYSDDLIILFRISFWSLAVYGGLSMVGLVVYVILEALWGLDESDKEEITRYEKRRKLKRARRLEITEKDEIFGENADLEQIKEFETKILNRVLNMPTIKSLEDEVSRKNWTYEIEIDRDTDLFSRYFSSVKISFFDSKKIDNADNGNIFELTFFDTICFVKKKQTVGLDISAKESFICSLEKHVNRIRKHK